MKLSKKRRLRVARRSGLAGWMRRLTTNLSRPTAKGASRPERPAGPGYCYSRQTFTQ